MTDQTPWLTNFRKYSRVHEMAGKATHPEILKLLDWADGKFDGKRLQGISDDETPYCASALCGALEEAHIVSPRTAWALNFANYGAKLAGPAYGAIGVRQRNGGGHVGIVVGRTANGSIVLYGANQGDEFKESAFDLEHFVAYRWVPGFPLPAKTGVSTLPILTALNETKVT